MAVNTTEEGIITVYTITLQVLSNTGGLVISSMRRDRRPSDVIERSKEAVKWRCFVFSAVPNSRMHLETHL